MPTTAHPPYGSVEFFAEIIRKNSETVTHTNCSAIGIVRVVLRDEDADADIAARIRNILAAMDLVRAELLAHR